MEGDLDEETDLDSYLESVKSDIDLESINLDEENEEQPVESPVIDEEVDIDNLEQSAEEAFKEAGIEGIGDEFEEDEEKGDEQLLRSLEEAELTPKEDEGEIQEGLQEPEETGVDETEEPTLLMEEENEPSEESFEGEVQLTGEEESILTEDIDLEAEPEEEEEEIVSVSGEDLEKLSEEESGLKEPAELEKEVAKGTEEAGTEETVIDTILYNDIVVILQYMDNLLGELPDEKIKEFSKSKYFSLYKEVFEKLNLA
jgi:hypothetical protein